jgi:NADPH:quinone reductase
MPIDQHQIATFAPIPCSMSALVIERLTQDFTGCRIIEVETPQPAHDEVLVRIQAASLGFPDLLMTRGEYQHKPSLPHIPGADIAGDVVATGDEVTQFKIGQRVVSTRAGGGFADYGVYSSASLRLAPPYVSYASAAAYGAAYLTAYVALVRRASLRSGEWVLVHGAAGGVGLAAVDLAKSMGARVIAASNCDEKLSIIAAEYAPDAILNTRSGFKERVKELTGGRGADVIVDPVGGAVFDESTRCIAFDGRLLVVGFASGHIPTLSVNIPLIKGFSLIGVRAGEYGRQFPDRGRENLDTIWKMLADGRTHPRVHAELPLSDWREAFAMMQERKIIGRVVLRPHAGQRRALGERDRR